MAEKDWVNLRMAIASNDLDNLASVMSTGHMLSASKAKATAVTHAKAADQGS